MLIFESLKVRNLLISTSILVLKLASIMGWVQGAVNYNTVSMHDQENSE